MTLDDAIAGKSYRIISVLGDRNVRRRLYDIGFAANSVITVVKRAPFHGAVLVTMRNCSVALRSFVAKYVTVGEIW